MPKQATAAVADAPATADTKPVKNLVMVSLNLPLGLKEILDAAAAAQNTTPANLARKQIAELYNYTLPAFVRTRTAKDPSLTPEQRADAAKAASAEKSRKANAILRAFNAGDLNLSLEEILAKYGGKPRAKKEKVEVEVPVAEPETVTV